MTESLLSPTKGGGRLGKKPEWVQNIVWEGVKSGRTRGGRDSSTIGTGVGHMGHASARHRILKFLVTLFGRAGGIVDTGLSIWTWGGRLGEHASRETGEVRVGH